MPQPNAVKCLVVDDEPRLRRVLVRLLEGEGFSCSEAGSGTEALELLQLEPVPLVISDLRMPQMDGVTLLREIIARWPTTAVIVVTAVAEVESAVACLQLGALDYVAKPFHLDEVRARVMQALDKRSLKMEVEDYRRTLEHRVQEQARRIEELSLERLQALVHFLEEKDPYTSGHSVRVADYSARIGRQMGLSQAVMDAVALGAELHDIGKIGVSEAVLHKAGKLTEAEYRHIMEDPVIGARILAPLMRPLPTAPPGPPAAARPAPPPAAAGRAPPFIPAGLDCRHDRHLDGRRLGRPRHRRESPDRRRRHPMGSGLRALAPRGDERRGTGAGCVRRDREGCSHLRPDVRRRRHRRAHVRRLRRDRHRPRAHAYRAARGRAPPGRRRDRDHGEPQPDRMERPEVHRAGRDLPGRDGWRPRGAARWGTSRRRETGNRTGDSRSGRRRAASRECAEAPGRGYPGYPSPPVHGGA